MVKDSYPRPQVFRPSFVLVVFLKVGIPPWLGFKDENKIGKTPNIPNNPPKTNIFKNPTTSRWMEDVSPFQMGDVQVPCWFSGVKAWKKLRTNFFQRI